MLRCLNIMSESQYEQNIRSFSMCCLRFFWNYHLGNKNMCFNSLNSYYLKLEFLKENNMPQSTEFQCDLFTWPPLESGIFENHNLFKKVIKTWGLHENFCFWIFQHHWSIVGKEERQERIKIEKMLWDYEAKKYVHRNTF